MCKNNMLKTKSEYITNDSMVLQWHYIPNQALAFSMHCPQDSLSLASVFQAHVPSNMTGSSITPSSHLFQCFFYSSLAMNCLLLGFDWYTVFLHSDYRPCPLQSSIFQIVFPYHLVSLMAVIHTLYCWNCGIRALTAAGLYNDLTFHVPNVMANCLCKNDSMVFNKQFNSNVTCTVFTPIPEHSTLLSVKLLHQLCFHSNQWNSCTRQTNMTKSYILNFD
jgi:hypothetical protein